MSYTINGWLSEINDVYYTGLSSDLFSMKLNYDEGISTVSADAQYSGNISSIEWIYDAGASHVHTYGFDYDDNNRLVAANYAQREVGVGGLTSTWINHDRYDVTSISYDDNGNLTGLQRRGKKDNGTYGIIDNLTYTYDSNLKDRLASVSDAADLLVGFTAPSSSAQSYSYDERGNMTTQSNKGLTTIAYNHLDLPHQFDLPTGDGSIDYLYSADGAKLQEVKKDDGGTVMVTRDYLGAAQYTDEDLQFVSHANGRVVPSDCSVNLMHAGDFSNKQTFRALNIESMATMTGSSEITYQATTGITFKEGFGVEQGALFTAQIDPCATPGVDWVYQYNIADHLGNNRVLFADLDGDNAVDQDEILQENHYYAFGLEMDGGWNNATSIEHRYRYNGKEFSEELGLYDYGARWYDPSIARWNAVDPLADTFPSQSPYNYSFNNPIRFIDPDGRAPEDIIILKGLENSGNLGYGHAAVLIGNDQDGWTYVSKDGPSSGGLIPAISTSGGSTTEIKEFATLEDFTSGEVSGMAVSDAYSMGVRFETTSDQDAEALDAAKTSAATDFNYTSKNCTSVCRDALDAVEINHGDFKTPSNLINHLWSNPESQPVIIENNDDGK